MKSKMYLMTKKKLFLVIILIVVAILSMVLVSKMKSGQTFAPEEEQTESTSLKLNDGAYTGTETLESGNLQVQVELKKGKIKGIDMAEIPKVEYENNKDLEKDIKGFTKQIVKNQSVDVAIDANRPSAYVLGKVLSAVNAALQQASLPPAQ